MECGQDGGERFRARREVSGRRLIRHVRGIRWSRTETSAYDQALMCLAEVRIAFACQIYQELG
jgi:hypothetical protein